VSHEPGPNGFPPVFSTHAFDNIGVPPNPDNPVYEYDPGFVDLGLGGFLDTVPEWNGLARMNDGKMKIPTVRNVAAGLGKGFTRSYMHNGVFKSLEQIVHFYNTRDVPEAGWPPPEVEENVNRELFEGVPLGDLQLSAEDEAAIVAFLATLTDRVAPGKPIAVITPRAAPQ
jgi:cytochrome c peroxidase